MWWPSNGSREIQKQLDAAVSVSRTTNSAEVALGELESRAKTYRSLHDTLLQRYMGAVQQETFPISEVRLISPALTPEGKSKPQDDANSSIGHLRRDRRWDRSGPASALDRSGLPNVRPCRSGTSSVLLGHGAAVARDELAEGVTRRAPAERIRILSREKVVSTQTSVIWSTIDTPSSQYTKSIRAIKLGVDLSLSNKSNKIIGVTSALPNEGKTTIAVSLAHLIGKTGKRVILVDGDFRNPWLSANLAPNAAGGIIDVIRGRRSLAETIWHHPKTNLTFLPTGRRSLFPEISEIFSADATRILFDQLRATYDYVIVDLPPLSPVVDVRATGSLVDGFILVIEWGRPKIDVVQHALHTAPNILRKPDAVPC